MKEEKRNIQITLDAARKWYRSDGILRELALEAFTEDELITSLDNNDGELITPLTYEDVAKALFSGNRKHHFIDERGEAQTIVLDNYGNVRYDPNNCTSELQCNKLMAINKLLNVAKYLNGDYEFNNYWRVWFLGLRYGNIAFGSSYMYNACHLVYFRTEALARQAVDILGEDTVRLALEPNY